LAVGYAMYLGADCCVAGYKNVDCFVDSERAELTRNIALAAAPVFILFFLPGYWAARQTA
jgi:hypothetical protein